MIKRKAPKLKVKVDRRGRKFEWYEGKWQQVINGERSGWWRYHDHYDRNGYCDNPARGY